MHDLLPYINAQLDITLNSLRYFMPEIYLGLLFVIVLAAGLVYTRHGAGICRLIAITGMVFVIAQDVIQGLIPASQWHLLFSGMLLLGHVAVRFKLIVDIITVLLLFYFAWDRQLRAHRKGLSDIYAIIIAVVFGLHLMIMASHLLSLYLAVEFVSLGSYLLVAYRSENGLSAGAGLKYVLFGAASSAVLLYGISLLYGFAGSAELFSRPFIEGLSHTDMAGVSLALILVLVGVGFKLSFVPMHFWVPDVYQGAATPVTAFLSTLPKIAGFALLFNFILSFANFGWKEFDFQLFFAIVGIVTMVAGNFAAVMQNNVKRLLAYSSIGHTGFALIAIAAFSPESITSLLFYLAVYAIANIGALMLASYFANTVGAENVEDYRGLGFRLPAASVCFVIILISLTGLPVTAGFIGKLIVFKSAYGVYQFNHSSWLLWLIITGAVTTVVSLFYYIKIPLYLFLKKGENNRELTISNQFLLFVVIIIAFFLILVGVFPDLLTKYL